jgi:hypothetical protein
MLSAKDLGLTFLLYRAASGLRISAIAIGEKVLMAIAQNHVTLQIERERTLWCHLVVLISS